MNLAPADIAAIPDRPLAEPWRRVISFRVYGKPKAQPRPRAFAKKIGDKFSARIYDAGTAEGWKGEIAIAAISHLPAVALAGPIRMDTIFLFDRPARLDRKKDPSERIYHDCKPDRDNLEKAVMDCLTAIGVWGDDAQVCAGEPRKYYVAKGERAGAYIAISVPGDAVLTASFLVNPFDGKDQ